MIYNDIWLIFSWIFLILWLLRLFFQPTTGFLAPSKYINSNKKRTYQSVIFFVFICIIFLPANIWFIKDKEIVEEKILPVQILFDVSLSMAGTDIKPSRFHGAKESLLFLLKELKWYNSSLIAFSWKPLVYMPFSTNTEALQNKFKSTVLADFNPTQDFVWTAIWDALLLWIKNIETLYDTTHWTWSLGKNTKKDLTEFSPGIIVLITDWDSNVGTNPSWVLPILQKIWVPVFTLGIWDKDFEVGRWKYGEEIMWYVNIPLLKRISKDTDWEFYKVKTISDFYNIFDEISQIVKQQEIKKISYEYFYLNEILLVLIVIFGGGSLFIRIKS